MSATETKGHFAEAPSFSLTASSLPHLSLKEEQHLAMNVI